MKALSISEATAQTVAVKRVRRKAPVLPAVSHPRRAGDPLVLIERDRVVADVGELIRIEEKLRNSAAMMAQTKQSFEDTFFPKLELRNEEPSAIREGYRIHHLSEDNRLRVHEFTDT